MQARTRVRMRALRRLALPTLIFVNKIDCGGARGEQIVAEIREKLTPEIVPMGSVQGVLDAAFGYYRLARDPVPVRPRSDHNPLHREEYLLHVMRRAGRAGGA